MTPRVNLYNHLTICMLEQMREHKRMLERAARKIERERGKVEAQEQKQLKEIQKLAK